MKRIVLLLLLTVILSAILLTKNVFGQSNVKTVTFSPTTDDIANPERGFMRQSNIFVDQAFDPGKLSVKNATDTVGWVYFHLENYRDPRDGPGVNLPDYQGKSLEPIGSGKGLDTINKTFADARSKGIKLVIRFLYVGYPGIGSNSNPATSQPDAPINLVQEHLNQLAPLMEQHKDVIAATQFGFVGYWGEWHSSKYLGDLNSRKAVMDAMLAAVPKDRMIQVRYPRYKQAFYGGPLTDSSAFSQSDLARIGLHDDALFKDSTDDGTYKSATGGTNITNYCNSTGLTDEACWRDYVKKDTPHVPVGGEAGTHSSTPSTYAQCPAALNSFKDLHFSFLHNGYSMVVLNSWTAQGCMDEIRKQLGYRFVLQKTTLPSSFSAGESIPLHLEITNEGFSAMYNDRPVYLVFENMSTGIKASSRINGADPRRWKPAHDLAVNVIDTNVTVPSSLPQGNYRIYLYLPDASGNLQSNSKYAVRFANANTWNESSGYNLITDNIQIGGGTGQKSPDLNGDGKVNIVDIGLIIDHYAESPLIYTTGDLNGDGKINIVDVGIIIDNYQI